MSLKNAFFKDEHPKQTAPLLAKKHLTSYYSRASMPVPSSMVINSTTLSFEYVTYIIHVQRVCEHTAVCLPMILVSTSRDKDLAV